MSRDSGDCGVLIGDGNNLILQMEPGAYILTGVTFTSWDLSIKADIETYAHGDYIHRIPGLRSISGTISFIAGGAKYTTYPISQKPLIQEYTITDMLKMIREKIKER